MFCGESVPIVSAGRILHNLRNGVSPSSRGRIIEKVLTLSSITQGSFDPSAWKEAQFENSPDADKRVTKADFLICRGNGNKTLVGVGEFSKENRSDLVFPDTVIAARTDKDEVELPYLRVAWRQPFVREQIEAKSRSTNGTYKINQEVISSINLPLPPLGEQRKFSAFVAAADKSKFAARQSLERLDAVYRALSKETFG